MKNVLLVLTFLFATQLAFAQTWTVDPMHSRVQFKAGHMGIAEIVGVFEKYTVDFDPGNEEMTELKLSVDIETKSLETEVEQRNEHLRSKDFFNVEKYPKMTFKSTSYKKKKKGMYELKGELTILGKTKTVALMVKKGKEVTGLYGERRIGFVAAGKINRIDFGLTFNADMDNGSKLISEEIEIFIAMEFMKAEKK